MGSTAARRAHERRAPRRPMTTRRAWRRSSGLPCPEIGGYAVVTGAGTGIGRGFALELGRRGYGVVVVGRRRDRLEQVADEVAAKGRETLVVQADLRGRDGVDDVVKRLHSRGGHPQVLVNCAGFGVWGEFASADLDTQLDQLRVHCEATVALTHALAPAMIARRSGAIVNVASSAGLQPVPYLAAYSATKAFVIALTTALDGELRQHGVSVTAVSPGPVETEFGSVSGLAADREPAPIVSVEDVVRASLTAAARRRTSVVPGRSMRLALVGAAALPRRVRMAYLARTYRPERTRS